MEEGRGRILETPGCSYCNEDNHEEDNYNDSSNDEVQLIEINKAEGNTKTESGGGRGKYNL